MLPKIDIVAKYFLTTQKLYLRNVGSYVCCQFYTLWLMDKRIDCSADVGFESGRQCVKLETLKVLGVPCI